MKGTVDIECGSTTMSLSSQEQVDFTHMTFVDGGSLLVVDGLGIRTIPNLAGKRVAVIPNTTTAPALEGALQRARTQATIVPVKTHEEGLAALESGAADAYASDRTILIGVGRRAAKPEKYALADELFSYEPHGFMVRRGDSAFRFVANRTLSTLYRSGDIGEIYNKWFGDMGTPGTALRAMYLLHASPTSGPALHRHPRAPGASVALAGGRRGPRVARLPPRARRGCGRHRGRRQAARLRVAHGALHARRSGSGTWTRRRWTSRSSRSTRRSSAITSILRRGGALARDVNDEIAAMVRQWPRRFAGLATLPMQDSAPPSPSWNARSPCSGSRGRSWTRR